MKTPSDPRHHRRRSLVEDLFKYDVHKQKISPEAKEIVGNLPAIDEYIVKAAPEFPIDKINKVDLSILRLAVYELEITRKEPKKVIIDEAIELAKEYGGNSSPSFVNGALGNIMPKASFQDKQ